MDFCDWLRVPARHDRFAQFASYLTFTLAVVNLSA